MNNVNPHPFPAQSRQVVYVYWCFFCSPELHVSFPLAARHLFSDFLLPIQPPPPFPSRQTPRPSHPRELDFGPFRVRFGSFQGPFPVRFGPFQVLFGVLGGVGVGSGRGASVRERNTTTLVTNTNTEDPARNDQELNRNRQPGTESGSRTAGSVLLKLCLLRPEPPFTGVCGPSGPKTAKKSQKLSAPKSHNRNR